MVGTVAALCVGRLCGEVEERSGGRSDVTGIGRGEDEPTVSRRCDRDGGEIAPVRQGEFGDHGDPDVFTDEGEQGGHVAYPQLGLQGEASGVVHVLQEGFAATVGEQERFVGEVGERQGCLGREWMVAVEHRDHVVLGQWHTGTLRRKVMRAVTDPGDEVVYDPAGKPGVANLLAVLAACTDGDPVALAAQFDRYSDLKRAVADAVVATLGPVRERYLALAADPEYLRSLLRDGAKRARERAGEKVRAAKEAIGLLSA
jgi:hypothetical protein